MAQGYVNIYECPHGCKAPGNKPIAATIRGWKKHMTKNHSLGTQPGWTDEQLATLVGARPNDPEAGRTLFIAEAEEGAAPMAEGAEAIEGPSAEARAAQTVKIKTDAASRKISAKMNKMQQKFAEQIPKLLNARLAQAGDEWKMEDKDMEFLSESIENCFDVLDVEFAVAPISKTLTSPLWVLLFPIIASVMIFLPKLMEAAKKKANEAEVKE